MSVDERLENTSDLALTGDLLCFYWISRLSTSKASVGSGDIDALVRKGRKSGHRHKQLLLPVFRHGDFRSTNANQKKLRAYSIFFLFLLYSQ